MKEMNLIKETWKTTDIEEFQEYLRSFSNPEKVERSKNLLNTSLPVLSLKTVDLKYLIENIAKGNYISFLDLMIWEYYENTAINGFLITKIKDFDIMKKYLDIYSDKADNWATCDLLSFNVKKNEEKYYTMVLEYIKSDKPFKRRIGMYILFDFIENDNYIDKIFELLDRFETEEHYYVNMMNSWLLCECFIRQKKKTLKYIYDNKLNKFTINKFVQKCRESRRVTVEDKEELLKYKRK